MSDGNGGAEYSIKAAAQATGLTVETLRAWERRYRVIEPKRNESGHRIYTSYDVSRLRRLRETTDRGHAIGKIAHLSNADLSCLIEEPAADAATAGAAEMLVSRIMHAVEIFAPEDCDQCIAMAFALLPVCDVIRDVLSPALREAGERWHNGEFSIGQERIVSSAVRHHISSLLNTYNRLAKGATVVFATLSGERHELGILMLATLAASRAVRVAYLGADMPPKEIGDYAQRVSASAVAISMIAPFENGLPGRQLAVLRENLESNVEIWIGGAGSSAMGPTDLPTGCIQMAGFQDFEQRVENLVSLPR